MPSSLPVVSLLAMVSMGGCDVYVDCLAFDYPLLAVSEGTLEFGEVAVGETLTRDLLVVNEGDLPLGIAGIDAGTNDHSNRFPFTWSRSEVEDQRDSAGDCEGFTPPPDGLALVLDGGCSLPVHLTFTPTDGGEVWGSIRITSPDLADFTRPDGALDEDWWVDPLHADRCVRLSGTCTGDDATGDGDTGVHTSGVPYSVCGVTFSQTACEGGDRIEASVLVHEPDGQDVQYEWTGDEGLEIDPLTGSGSVQITCPTIHDDSDPTTFSLYVVAEDEDGNDIWDFADLRVWPPGALYGTWPPCESGVATWGCHTSPAPGPSGVALAALAALLAARRRDRPPRRVSRS